MAGVEETVDSAPVWMGLLWNPVSCEDLPGTEAGAASGESNKRGSEEERGL